MYVCIYNFFNQKCFYNVNEDIIKLHIHPQGKKTLKTGPLHCKQKGNRLKPTLILAFPRQKHNNSQNQKEQGNKQVSQMCVCVCIHVCLYTVDHILIYH